MLFLTLIFILAPAVQATTGLDSSSLSTYVNSLDLNFEFNPVKAAYWTGYPHHRRTPFALSPDGKSAYLAYLDNSETDVHVQKLDPSTFTALSSAVTVTGAKEAGGLIAHNDGFALLTNEALPSGTTNAPADSTPVPVLYRYTDGIQTWKTFLGGPGVHVDFGLAASPDLNGDLVYSEAAGLYGAYFVVTDYTGDAAGHFGDSIEYVSENGTLETITGATSSWGCSHNTGIAFEAADTAPFASICAEDQGAIWLNTKTQGMGNDGVKISNENTTNGASNEPMGGMSGSYSALARFIGSDSYIFSWVSRGAIDLTENTWMGAGYTHALNRTVNRNVAIALFSNKDTIVGPQASSAVGAASGDDQINWITKGTADTSNAHVAAFDTSNALVTWEEIADPICDFIAMGCRGTFSGSYFQLVDSSGGKIGSALESMDTFVAGDMVTMPDGRICWPYVSVDWRLDQVVGAGLPTTTTKKMSFACMSLNGNRTSASSTPSPVSSAVSAAEATSSAKPTGSTVVASLSFGDARLEPVSSITPRRTTPGTSLAVQISTSKQASAVPSSSEVPYTTTITNMSFDSARTTGLASRSAEAASSGVSACGSPLFVTITETDTITVTEVASEGFGTGAKVTEEPLCGQTMYKTVTNTATVTVGL